MSRYSRFFLSKTLRILLLENSQHYWEELCRSPLFPRCPTRAVDILRVYCLSLRPKTVSISYSL
jgi:hypothetical protein